ncbi:MAG TPA: hypothetical protein VK844_01475, partial [Hyphomicrobiales bacterium]|nr:hypothetical protein [Hyphomicrobiales bacterium]
SADLSLVFRLNTDAALPASHTVDVIYHGPDEPDGPVTNVAGFMVRTDGGEANVPLHGAGALVVPGQFLFGLSGAPAEREHNVSQLTNGDWLLVPVRFESDRRSVVVIEKGETGDAAMAKAFAAWDAAQGAAQNQ